MDKIRYIGEVRTGRINDTLREYRTETGFKGVLLTTCMSSLVFCMRNEDNNLSDYTVLGTPYVWSTCTRLLLREGYQISEKSFSEFLIQGLDTNIANDMIRSGLIEGKNQRIRWGEIKLL